MRSPAEGDPPQRTSQLLSKRLGGGSGEDPELEE